MYDADGETLLMAHALRRIQYSTCRMEDRQFAFVSRNPHNQPNHLYCHLFVGSQPSEVQVLNLLLCRSFQLQYLAAHPEDGDQKASATNPVKPQKKGVSDAVVREPLDPEEVSQNVNALVSFRRLPVTAEVENGSGQNESPTNAPRSSPVESPYCSPTLVRKKAIRSKVLRSGAYRCPKSEHHSQEREAEDTCGVAVAELSEKLEVLLDAVWFNAGVQRDKSTSLLRNDRMGAFLVQPDMDSAGHFTLYMSTQCGVIPYKIYKTPKHTFYFEHLPQEFPSLAALVAHHSGADSSLFFQLAHGRVNPCYETQDVKTDQQHPLTQNEAAQEAEESTKREEEPTQATETSQTVYHI
ncbi:SH2 domain-containing protein 5 isoform X2 [Dendropsophus ebraccatus]